MVVTLIMEVMVLDTFIISSHFLVLVMLFIEIVYSSHFII